MKKIPYIRMWTRLFDFKSKDSLKTFMVDGLLTVLAFFILTFVTLANMETGWGLFAFFVSMAHILLPWPSLMVRRLRDAGYSPCWALLLLVPFLGFCVVEELCTYSSAKGEDAGAAAKKRKYHFRFSLGFLAVMLLVFFLAATCYVWLSLLVMMTEARLALFSLFLKALFG